jgi:hypothetical protein
MRTKLAGVAGGIAIAALAAACSSSPTTTTGTETWQAKETGAAVVGSQAPTYHLTFTGPVKTTGTFTPPNNNAVKSTVTFKTTAGNLVVNADLPQNANPPTVFNPKTCLFVQTLTGTYTVVGSKSTGSFKGATGHGTVKDVFSATVPKLANGTCNQSNSAQPLAAGAYTTLYVTGPLTVTS